MKHKSQKHICSEISISDALQIDEDDLLCSTSSISSPRLLFSFFEFDLRSNPRSPNRFSEIEKELCCFFN